MCLSGVRPCYCFTLRTFSKGIPQTCFLLWARALFRSSNSSSSHSPAPGDGLPFQGKHGQVRVQQLWGASAGAALAEERPAHQVVQTGQEPNLGSPAHQPAGAGGRRLLPVHRRQRAGDGVRHGQADGDREGGSAQPAPPPDCRPLLQHQRPAHLGEARVQLGPDHRLLRALPTCGRCVPPHSHASVNDRKEFMCWQISVRPLRFRPRGVPVCHEQRHHGVPLQGAAASHGLHIFRGGLLPDGRQPPVTAGHCGDAGGRWVIRRSTEEMKGGKITKERRIAFQPFFFICCFSLFIYLLRKSACTP